MHPLNRPYQAETYQKVIKSTKKWIIISAPVGSGKSAYAAQAGHDGYRVMSLVKTKVLQEQYKDSYDFKVVKGKGSYACLNGFAPAADLCRIEGLERKENCLPFCPYPQDVEAMLDSNFASLNYSKYLLECRDNGLVSRYSPQLLFLDECHQLSDITIDWSGLTITWDKVAEWIEPEFISPHSPQVKQVRLAVDWLNDLKAELAKSEPRTPDKDSSSDEIRRYRAWDNLYKKIKNTLSMIDTGKEYWFCQSDEKGGFRLKPLTARFHFSQLFNKAKKVVLMSATMKETDLPELGIYDDYDFISVPNSWPASDRPIEDLKAPAYTAKSDYQEKLYHSQVISNRINQTSRDWTSLIHVTSKKMAAELGNMVKKQTNRPVWIPTEERGTEHALNSFLDFLACKKGGIGVTWQFYEGVSLDGVNTVISARVPYSDFSDPFETQRFNFDKRAGMSRVANLIEQQQGRNRRGYAEHYGPDAAKLNCLADGKWSRLRNMLSKDFTDAVITLPPK